MELRNLIPEDIIEVLNVQKEVYVEDLLELEETFKNKIMIFPEGCWGVFVQSKMVGYVFSHPWLVDKLIPLHYKLTEIPADANCLYIHDLAIRNAYQKNGYGTQLFTKLKEIASIQHLQYFNLVAVQKSTKFWLHVGFKPKYTFLYTAGVNATYMSTQ